MLELQDPTRIIDDRKNATFTDPNANQHDDFDAWKQNHDMQCVKRTEELTANLVEEYKSCSNEQRYQLLKAYYKSRRDVLLDHANGGTLMESTAVSFATLVELEQMSDSVYLRRYIHWLKNIEVHEALDGLPFMTEVDYELSDPLAVKQYEEYWDEDLDNTSGSGLHFRFKPEYSEFIAKLPNSEQAVYQYGIEMLNENPFTAGDSTYYPPDPFTEMVGKVQHIDELPLSDIELAAETASLFGVDDIRDLSLKARRLLYSVGLSLTEAKYHRIESITAKFEQHERLVFANAFLATEFGADYGDILLSIAENTTQEQAENTFTIINNFREHSLHFSKWFRDYDPDLAAATEKAMNERLTDALYSIELLSRDGKLEVDVAPHRQNEDYENDGSFMIRLESFDAGVEILKGLEKSLQLIQDTISAPDVNVSRVVQHSEQFMIYRFSSADHGEALLYIRPEGAKGYDRNMEYGNRNGVEASISFIVNPSEPHKLDSQKDPHGVSIRFDREGRMVDESPFSEDRDPTRSSGSISIDISSCMGDGRHMPVKIGRFVAAGNILRAAAMGGEESLHHNNNHFNQARYGESGGFSNLAIYIAHMAEAMIAIQQNGTHASRYSNLPGILRREDVEAAA